MRKLVTQLLNRARIRSALPWNTFTLSESYIVMLKHRCGPKFWLLSGRQTLAESLFVDDS